MKRRRASISLVFRYLLSSFGVVLMACAIIGLLLYFSSTAELGRVYTAATSEKLRLSLKDIENQTQVMSDISFKIRNSLIYMPSYVERNPYYEVDLLTDFKKYKDSSPIVLDYFLMYYNDQWVYRTNDRKHSFSVFMDYQHLTGDQAALYEAINGAESLTVISCPAEPEDLMMLVFPVYTMASTDTKGKALLGFFVSGSTIRQRLTTIVGELPGDVWLYYQGQPIAALQSDGNPAPVLDTTSLTAQGHLLDLENQGTRFLANSSRGQFQLVMDVDQNALLAQLSPFTAANRLYFIIISSFLLLIAAYVGYANYKPIRKLSEKYRGIYTQQSGNEISNMEAVFDAILREKKDAEHNLQAQYTLIQNQILNLLLGGDDRYAALVSTSFMGIRLPGPVYGLLLVRVRRPPLDAALESRLATLIGELSEEDMFLYFTNTKYEGIYAVIASLPHKGALGDAAEYVRALLEEHIEFDMATAPVCDQLSCLKETMAHAMTTLSPCENTAGAAAPVKGMPEYNEILAQRLLTAIRCDNAYDAQYYMSRLIQETRHSNLSFLFQRFVYSQVLYRIGQLAREKGRPIPPERLGELLTCGNPDELSDAMQTLMDYVCGGAAAPGTPGTDAAERRGGGLDHRANPDGIIEYLNLHFDNPDMSLDLLSDTFALSNKYISSLIKERTGKTYKDYLIWLRIERAQELLSTKRLSVTEVCERSGYTHLPNFIKTFKRITGFTPSNYVPETDKAESRGG